MPDVCSLLGSGAWAKLIVVLGPKVGGDTVDRCGHHYCKGTSTFFIFIKVSRQGGGAHAATWTVHSLLRKCGKDVCVSDVE